MDDVAADMQRCINDRSLYLDREEWFDGLQDQGTDVAENVKTAILNNPDKRFTRKILFAFRLHPKLYVVSKSITDLMTTKKDAYFGKMPKNATANAHEVGGWIAMNRLLVNRSDFHTADPEYLDLASGVKYKDLPAVYILSQKDVIRHFKTKWGMTIDDALKPTVDDKLRLAIILFDEDIREYIPDMLGKTLAAPSGETNTNNRPNMDAANGRKRAGHHLLHQRFKDIEYEATMPPRWLADSTRQKVDEVKGAGTYDAYGVFDVNNVGRINLPWEVNIMK